MMQELKEKMKSALEITLSNYILGCCDSRKYERRTAVPLPKPYVQTIADEAYVVVSVGVTDEGEILGGVLGNGEVAYIPLPIEFLFYAAVTLECDCGGVFEFLGNIRDRELEG